MQKLFGQEYDYLTLGEEQAKSIIHTAQYSKEGTGKSAQRKIFGNNGGAAPYDSFEIQQLAQLKQKLNGLASHYPDYLMYRFLYAYKFSIDDAYSGIKNHEEWLQNPQTFQMNNSAQQLLDKGIIYLGGRDKKMRPSIIFQVGLIDQKKIKGEEFLVALNTVFMIAQQYFFYEGYVENWIILIDTAELGIFSLPMDILKKIISTTSAHYVGSLEKLYLLNPSTGLNMSWSLISKFIDERSNKKIQFLTKKDFSKLKEYFDPNQLETQFGGTMPKITSYWPPQPTIQIERKQVQLLTLNQINNYEPSVKSQRSQRSKQSEPYKQQYEIYQAPFKRSVQPENQINLKESIQKSYFDNKVNLSEKYENFELKQDLKTSRIIEERPSQLTQNFGYESSIQKPQKLDFQNAHSESSKEIQHFSFQDFQFTSLPLSNQQSNQGKLSQKPSVQEYTKFAIIEEEPEKKSLHNLQTQENQNFMEEPSDQKYRLSQSLRKSYRTDYNFKQEDFHPPYPQALPKGPIVLNNNNYQDQHEEVKIITKKDRKINNDEQIQPNQQVGFMKRSACFQARDGKYTACQIF